MRVIPAHIHRILDYITVLAFLVAPSVLGLTGVPATLAYVLAPVHFVLTLLTRFTSDRGVVPFPLHGTIELIVAIALIAAPFVLHWDTVALRYYVCTGIIFLIVWMLTDYRSVNERSMA